MSVTFYTGRKSALKPALLRAVTEALNADERSSVVVMVPEQLTLDTERGLLEGLNLIGSFRLMVLSPKRLCDRIFDEAGRPERVRIDDRGRALLMGHVLRSLKKQLKWYAGARDRRGFEMRVVEEVIRFKQAGVDPDALLSLSEETGDGALKWKMHDLSLLYAAYEEALAGRFQDGEDEIREAMERLSGASSLRDASVFAFGFDLTTPIWNDFVTRLAGFVRHAAVFLPLENDGNARDFTLFGPLQASYERLLRAMNSAGIEWKRESLNEAGYAPNAAGFLAREVFCSPLEVYRAGNTSVQLAALRNPMEEARFAAALTRRLAMKNGWRYRDVMVLVGNTTEYMDALTAAFAEYEIPLFAAESRPLDRHPLARLLLETMRLLSGADADLSTLLLTGYAAITDDEGDRMLGYIARNGLRAREVLKPLRRGDAEMRAELEPIRQRLAEPMIELNERLNGVRTLSEQLTAIFAYLERLNAAEKGDAMRERLIALGQRELAAEDAQVWNRVIGTLDQMNELLGDARVSKEELTEMFARAFSASQIKPLPQSGDAVVATGAARAGSGAVEALIVIGQSAASAADDGGLFDSDELANMAERLKRFLGSGALARTRTDRMYLKNALAMARRYLCITYPMSTQDGAAVTPGALVEEAKTIFPGVEARGGVAQDEQMEAMRVSAVKAAENCLAVDLSEGRLTDAGREALNALKDSGGVDRLRAALGQNIASERITPKLAREVYGSLSKVSVTRLESFAACPFAHFVKYALKPEPEEPFGMNAKDEGTFYHDAVHAFLEQGKDEPEMPSEEEAVQRMNAISDALLEGAIREVIGENGIAQAEARRMRRILARAARALSAQLRGSAFRPVELEMAFGEGRYSLKLHTNAQTRLDGRIDRIDGMADADDRYLRVIDYKRGGKKLDAGEVYEGLQLQLILYLAEAIHKYGARSAGAFYFRVDDPVINTESLNEEEIERLRAEKLRMEGILPRDSALIRKMAQEPERVFRVRFLQSTGEPDARTNMATEDEFSLLMRHSLEHAARFTNAISTGETEISPAHSEISDACRFCDYRGACMLDKQIPGGKGRRIRKMSFDEVYERIREEMDEPTKE